MDDFDVFVYWNGLEGALYCRDKKGLHEFAWRMGLNRRYNFRDQLGYPHYEIDKQWRFNQAVKFGAHEVSEAEMMIVVRGKQDLNRLRVASRA